ncbi:cytochrome d terminal oxidase subunit 1 [Rhodoplanes elegans]|uniref:Cytochrome d terminal oxidase subunit 1 n=1 Tax=Rhodoplanes elegans TaxID=29408 RepID=A0A327K726_9BRAD|nr:cytochrome ubiquinol oxidase subunit I [Rhodoplanes elegans]MBK5958460.1 cytochrome d terminal oxidase subunit 1 [Rhodoplanes elegans]RAI33766.1 cytochrome d terminal oxidase subunit 1 [Rhodoplanes elegans]
MIDPTFVELSRWQFAAVAMYHFIFVPLTIGLIWILVIMESVYVMTGKQIYQDMSRFWTKLFAINFALGVTTGLTMEFQFGTNWAYYSHYVGDVFGAPLAIEGLMAFFLESTFVGLLLLGRDRLSKVQYLLVVFLTALGTNLSALWILVANAWMQNPVGAEFSAETMRMEMTDFAAVLLNPVAQVKFIHTTAAGYMTASMFVIGISAWYLLKRRDVAFAKRSFAVAAGFGLASSLSVIVLGDESGYELGDVQKMKLAAIEAEWHTQPPPASFNVVAITDQDKRENSFEIKLPWALGLIATRSIDKPVLGIDELVAHAETRVRSGAVAYAMLEKLRSGDKGTETRASFDRHKKDLGYGLLLKRYVADPATANEDQIRQAAWDSVPHVPYLFWSFRIMVGLGFLMLGLFAASFYLLARGRLEKNAWLLRVLVWCIPLPWLASETGWFVAEYGRQPWAIGEVLPTFLATSALTTTDIVTSMAAYLIFYSILLAIELYLMVRFARLGPSSLHTGRYHHERADTRADAAPAPRLVPAE